MKIAVLVSGGVDSSVALALLKQQGHEITAFYLKIWLEDELSYLGHCPWQEDLTYVQSVCSQLDVPLEVISLQKEYWSKVVRYVLDEVKAGRTPNPDVLCNQQVKFGVFFDAVKNSFDKIASGHYAQIQMQNGRVQLLRAPDLIKDQTYFLSYLSQQQLSYLLFPIGHLQKAQVRDYAHSFDLPNKSRKDSQGICFLGKLKFNDFMRHYLGELPGDMVEFETGNKVSEHKGFWYHTIGQRKGSGLSGGPWYVVNKDAGRNVVYVSRAYQENSNAMRNIFTTAQCNWIAGVIPQQHHLQVKIRHGAMIYNAHIDFVDIKKATVTLERHDQGIAPGQFAAFYDDQVCLGAGIIE